MKKNNMTIQITVIQSFQDSRIASWIIESATPVIIAGNKTDLIESEKNIVESYRASLIQKMPYMTFAPFIMISAKEGRGVKRLYSELDKIMKNSFKKIPQESLDLLLEKLLIKRPPPKAANVRPIVTKLYQESVRPPVFKLSMKHYRLDKIPQHWINYVKNSIYKEFDYYGVPVVIKMKKLKSRTRKR